MVSVEHIPSDNPALRYTRLFEAAQDGILLLNFPDGVIEDANPYILNLLGYSLAELTGKKLWELGLIADKSQAIQAHQTILVDGFVRYENLDLVAKSGHRLPTEFICNSYHVDGDIVIQCNIRDISARRKAELALLEAHAGAALRIMETIQSLSNVIEARDPFTGGHQKRVTDLAVAIAKDLELTPAQIDGLRFAAQIHDIGKIGIPSEILTKPSALSPLEIALLRGHAQAGYDIIKPLTFPWPIAKIILQHHERLNGSGYPNALKGNSICLEARILAVADAVEAMATDRPYRPAMPLDTVLHQIETESGTLFDERVVATCLNLFRNAGYQLLATPDNITHGLHRGGGG